MGKTFSKIAIFISTIGFLLFSLSCGKEDRVPTVYVDFQIFIDLPEYSHIKTPGNYLYLNGGSRGIILYCESVNSYLAYDRHCPYHPAKEDAFLYIDSLTSSIIHCKGCGSRFLTRDGSVLKGPAKYWLIRYSTNLNANLGILYVYNSF